MRRTLLAPAALAFAGLAALSSIGCGGTPTAPTVVDKAAPEDMNVNVGEMLFSPKPQPRINGTVGIGSEPIIFGSTLQFDQRQQLASEVDGKIELLAVRDDSINPTDPLMRLPPARNTEKKVKHLKLREGTHVNAGDIIVMLDDVIVSTKMESADKSKKASEEVLKSATEGYPDLTKQKVKLSKEAWDKGSGSFVDYLQDMIPLTRLRGEPFAGQAIDRRRRRRITPRPRP